MTSAERAKDLATSAGLRARGCHRSRPRDDQRDAGPHDDARGAVRARRPSPWPASRPSDVDVLLGYDSFTITALLHLEDLGFCAKGEGGPFVEDGTIGPGGSLPMNTNGGGLSYTHPGMYGMFLIVEAVRQLRRECGERQVGDAEIAVAHGSGMVLSVMSTLVLGTARCSDAVRGALPAGRASGD